MKIYNSLPIVLCCLTSLGLLSLQSVAAIEPTAITTAIKDVNLEIDTDGDGVYDYQDTCPNTPWNIVVDEKGCKIQEYIIEEPKNDF